MHMPEAEHGFAMSLMFKADGLNNASYEQQYAYVVNVFAALEAALNRPIRKLDESLSDTGIPVGTLGKDISAARRRIEGEQSELDPN